MNLRKRDSCAYLVEWTVCSLYIKVPLCWPFVRGIRQWPVDSIYKLPVMRKHFPCHDVNIVMLDIILRWICPPYLMLFCWASFFYCKVLYFIPLFYYPQTVSVIMNPIFHPSLIFAWCHRMLHKTPWTTHSTSQEICTCVAFSCALLRFDKSPFAPWYNIDGLVQERRNSSALALEVRLSCTNPSIWPWSCCYQLRHCSRNS